VRVCCPGVNERSRCGITGGRCGGGRGQRSLLQERRRRRRRRRRTCTDKVRSHRAAAAATIHFSCVHYITITIIIPLQFETIVIQESVHRT